MASRRSRTWNNGWRLRCFEPKVTRDDFLLPTPRFHEMLVTCAHFYDPLEAHVVRARLEAEGVPATVADDQMINANWPLSVALGGARVQVPDAFLAEARAIIEHYSGGTFADDVDAETGSEPHHCPRCSSRSIARTVPASQKALAVGVYVVSGATFPTRESLHRCRDCGNAWLDA